MQQTARTEFAQALKAIAAERGLDPNVIIDTINQAIIAAFKRDAKERGEETEGFEYEAAIDPVSGETKVFSWPSAGEEATEEEKKKAAKAKKDVTPPGFGRIAAQTAKQVIHQKIREAEKGAIMEEFEERVGALVSGLILRFDGPNVRVDLGRTEALMPVEERIPNERLNLNQRLTFLLKRIEDTVRGRDIILSRADPEFVEKLFAREVPEIASKSVEIKSVAREAGVRTKVTVYSSQSGVDPVGSCVGQKGVRVQAVTNEIGGERVDVIPFSEDIAELIKSSLSPAEGLEVKLDKKNKLAKVTAPEDQLSMAIGRDGQNVRLTSKLTGYRIEVEGSGTTLPVEEKVEVVAPEPEVKKITKTKAKKLAKKEKAKSADEAVMPVSVEPEAPVQVPEVIEQKPEEAAAQEAAEEKDAEDKMDESEKVEMKTDDGSVKSDNEDGK